MTDGKRFWAYSKAMAALRLLRKEELAKRLKSYRRRKPLG